MITRANATLGALLGFTSQELEGKHIEQVLTIAGRIFFQTHFFPLLRLQGAATEIFLLLRRADGGEVGTLCNAVRSDRDGKMVSDCVLMEVRERRKYEDQLLKARRDADSANGMLRLQATELESQHALLHEQATELELQQEELQVLNEQLMEHSEELELARTVAEEASRAKSQFLANMSHELRTPLNAIGGYVQLIQLGIHGPVTDMQRDALERVARSQAHLLRLINQLLDLARVETGHIEYSLEPLPLAAVIADVIPMLEPQVAAAGLTLTLSVPPDLTARGDREKVQQVMINLLTNAWKFTDADGRISIEGEGRPSDGTVLVRVADSGMGIHPDKLGEVFEPFVQVEQHATRRTVGSGLGLAISREFARGMGGDLLVESAPGVGSTFTLVLPEFGKTR